MMQTCWGSIGAGIFLVLGSVIIGEGVDLLCLPRCWPRSMQYFPLRVLPVLVLASFLLFMTGGVGISLALSASCALVFVIGSNIKWHVLNEPLVFTDLALIPNFFRHPKFYLQVVPVLVRFFVILAGLCLICGIIWASSLIWRLHLLGWVLFVASSLLLWLCLSHMLLKQADKKPDIYGDTARYGLFPSLLLYWGLWKKTPALPPIAALRLPASPPDNILPDCVLIVQCESFAEPSVLAEDFDGAETALPGLEQARRKALQWGALEVSGFGAYTMRSEYAMLCGLEEDILSFRQFDPFLTAQDSPLYALPHRLGAFYKEALFVHPYDLRFYNRDTLMPCLGFTENIGREAFARTECNGPYVSDAALGRKLLDLVQTRKKPFLTYCVTMENHGPWKKGRLNCATGKEAWLKHVHNSDAMLAELCEGLEASGRDVLLVFFGDHRPALTTLREKSRKLTRTTPYVMMRFNARHHNPAFPPLPTQGVTLTPAGLHQALLAELAGKNFL